ncbi:MAG TPA: helix-turn-helix transcriptional regulator [Cyclobacteriaceae bacterium]|jgi:DNA-binding PadR family transcriptional regulator
MVTYSLGEFEEVVLLTVAILQKNAYGVSIKLDIQKRLNRKVSVGALQSALRRMERKGYIKSHFGEATPERGGKRKRYFEITLNGKKAVSHAMEDRISLWKASPELLTELGRLI